MASRLENLDKVADFLRDRYTVAMTVQKQLEQYERLGDMESAQAIVDDPAFRDNSKFRFTLKELTNAKAGGLYYQQLYYALVVSEQKYVGKREQPPALLERGIHTKYNDGKNTQEYSYSPALVAASLSARLRPSINVTGDTVNVRPDDVTVVPVEIPVPVGVMEAAPVETKAPTGPVLTEREQKILACFERSYQVSGPVTRALMDRALDSNIHYLAPEDLVKAVVEASGISIPEALSKENGDKNPTIAEIRNAAGLN